MNTEELFAYNRTHYGDVIRTHRVRNGLTQNVLAERLGVKKNYISNWEAGRARPDLNIITALCEVLGITLAEFFGVSAQMFSAAEMRHIKAYRSLSDANRRAVDALVEAMHRIADEEETIACKKRFRRILQYDLRVSAGFGEALGDPSGETVFIDCAAASEADCLITVNGDSMLPRFHDGDRLLVQYCNSIEEKKIGIFVTAGEGYVKEYRKDGLHSLNPAYPVLHFSEDDDVRCVGRVLGIAQSEMFPTAEEIQLLRES